MPSIQDLGALLSKTGIPEEGLKPLTDKVADYVALVNQNNEWVAQINVARAQDPSNTEFLDSIWAAKAPNDDEMAKVEEEYQALVDQTEKLLKKLRDFARSNIPQPLSEDAVKETRKKVNDAAPTISETRKGIAANFEMLEGILKLTAKDELPEGGLLSLLPNPESLKNARGRKASTATGEGKKYVTRVGEVLLDGNSTNVNGAGKFAYAANALTEKFNGKAIAQNKVTAEEMEEAYFASLPGSPELRSLSSTEIPEEHTFTFTKEILAQNPNDDGFTKVPQNVKVTVRNVNYGQPKAETTEPKNDAAPAATENKSATPEPMKIDTKSETRKASEAKQQPAKPAAK